VQHVPILSPQSYPEDSLVAVPFTHTSPSSPDLGQRSCMELDLFPEEEPITLSYCPADKFRGKSGKRSSNWVLQLVQEFSHLVGLSCDGFEGRLSALFEDIVAKNDEKEQELKALKVDLNGWNEQEFGNGEVLKQARMEARVECS